MDLTTEINIYGTYDAHLGAALVVDGTQAVYPTENDTKVLAIRLKQFLAECKPTSPLETFQLIQIFTLQSQAMAAMRTANSLPNFATKSQLLSLANKLLLSCNKFISAFEKNRRGGNQIIRVDHVHVNDGGQAIVGNVPHS